MTESRAERAEAMRLRLVQRQDDQLRRCWFCGEWAYRQNDCTACTAPANRDELAQRDTA